MDRISASMPRAPSVAPEPGSGADTSAGHAPGLVWAFRFRADGSSEEFSECAVPCEDGEDGWLWLHFNLADARLAPYLRTRVEGIPPAAVEQLLCPGDHQQLHTEGHCVYGVFADLILRLDGLSDDLSFLHFAGNERLLLTGRREWLNSVEATRKALRSGRKIATPGALMETILNKVAGGVEKRADVLANALDNVEEHLIVNQESDHPERLARVRRLALRLHRLLSTQRALLNRFERRAWRISSGKQTIDTGRLSQRLDWLDHEMVSLRDRAHLLQEEVSLKMTGETNRNLQLLAIVTTVFLPATLVPAIFGMNVGGLPLENDRDGFIWAIVILVIASGLVFWILRRLGLFRR